MWYLHSTVASLTMMDHTRMRSRGVSFIEISPLRDNGALDSGIVELPTFVSIWVSNEDTFLIVGLEYVTFVLLDMHISSQSLDSKVGHIWLASMPQFKGSGIVHSYCGALIPHMDKGT